MKYLLGVDIGSSGIRAGIFDENGNYIKGVNQDVALHMTPTGEYTIGVDEFSDTLFTVIRETVERSNVNAEDIIGLSSSLTGGRFLNMDENYNMLYDIICAGDRRCNAKMMDVFGTLIKNGMSPAEAAGRAGTMAPCPMVTLGKQLAEEDPELFAKVKHWSEDPHPLFCHLLGGDFVGVQSYDTKSAIVNPFKREVDMELVAAYETDISLFPELRYTGENCGYVSEEAAEKTGLKAGTPIYAGINDAACHMFALNALEPDDATCIMGGWGVLMNLSKEEEKLHGPLIIYGSGAKDSWLVSDVIAGIGMTNKWLHDNIAPLLSEKAKAEGMDLYDYMSLHAEQSGVGANGVILTPEINGNIYNPKMRMNIMSVSTQNIAGDILRAAYEGMAYEWRIRIEALEQTLGHKMKRIFLSGGCSKSWVITQIMADVMGLEVYRISDDRPELNGVRGAVMSVALGAGMYRSLEEACAGVNSNLKKTLPIMENHEKYNALYEEYKRIRNELNGNVFHM